VTPPPTLGDLTLAHSQRLSEIFRARDARLAEAQADRDRQLRALPGAAKAYQKYDDELASAREKQLAAEARAEVSRTSAVIAAADLRRDRLEDAQQARRTADVDGVMTKRRQEDAAEAKFLAALDAARNRPASERSHALQDADRARRLDIEQAKRAHDEALSTSQQKYRNAVDGAVIAERRDNRDGEREYVDALKVGEAAARAARAAADQTLLAALATLPDAREIVQQWREQVAAIGIDAATAEKEEFARFRRERQSVRV
jgi:hypothetical protein